LPKSKAPAQTLEEPKYLKQLVDNKTRVLVVLRDDEEAEGTIEYWDATFIRLTCEPEEPNLFIYKHDIKYIAEIENEK
jgi:sRNA-binding regulator protein Hfq